MDTLTLGGTVGNAMEFETKGLSETEDCYHFEAYAAAFNNVDRGKDMILPGAFAKSLRENGLPQLLYQHEMKDVVGLITDAKEDNRGLLIKGDLPKADDFVRGRLYPQLKHRAIKSMSIGYKPTVHERRKSDGVRLLKEIELWECSFVTIPMNPRASVRSVKGLVPFQDLGIDREAKAWDAKAALARIKSHFGDSEEIRRAFLFADEEKSVDEWDARLLIADVDENGACLKANHLAILKASAVVFGAGDVLPEGAEDEVKSHLETYFQRLNLQSPSKTWSVTEFEAQDESEREARLRGLGVSRDLTKKLLSGLREADRPSTLREAGSPENAHALLIALADAFGARKR